MAQLHFTIFIFFSFIFAISSSSFAPPRHPFDPLTETELKLVQTIINKTYPIGPSHKFTFQYVGLNEPDKSLVLSWYSSPKHTTKPPPRQAFIHIGNGYPMLTNDEQEAATELVLKFKSFRDASEAETERVIRMMPFYLDGTVNMYLRPIEGMTILVNLDVMKVTEFKDRLTVIMPKANGTEYRISELKPPFGPTLKNAVLMQPDGPGFK
ncbi:unnamed protein product, partial [Brassica oleracea]